MERKDDIPDALTYAFNVSYTTETVPHTVIPSIDTSILYMGPPNIMELFKQQEKESLQINQNKKEERYNMERNEVLNLYVKRYRKSIEQKFNNIIEEEYNNLEEVREFNELVNTFTASLDELANRYNTLPENDNITIFNRTGYLNSYAWEINPSLRDHICKKHEADFKKEMNELDNLANEVQAVLSISDDKDYQIEVLKNYNILDKKGKLNI